MGGSDANSDVGQADDKLLTTGNHRVDGNRGRKNAREKSVQGAAAISAIFGLITVMMMKHSLAAVGMVLIEVKSDCGRKVSRASKRRRYDAGELGDHEQGDQHADKTSYCP